MKHTCRVLITAFFFGLAVLVGAASTATADDLNIAVMEIEGARNARLRKQVTRIVKKKHNVLSHKEYERAAREVGAKRMRPKDVRRVADQLRCDGVVEGMLVAEDDGYVLRLRLREGATGKTVRKFTVFLKSPKMPRKIRKELSKRLHAAIGNLEPIAADDEWADEGKGGWEEEAVEEDRDRRRSRRSARRERRERRSRARDLIDDRDVEAVEDRDDGFIDDDDEFDDEFDEDFDEDLDDADEDLDDEDLADEDLADDRRTAKRDAPNARRLAVSISAGGTVIGRQLKFTARQGLMTPPSEYNGAYAPGVFATGEFYPMAFDDGEEGAARNLGFGFDVERSVGLQSQITGPDGMEPVKLATQRQRYGFRVQYRHNFGSKKSHPTATLSVGYNKLSFVVDKTNVPEGIIVDVPDVEYTYVDPGVALRFPAGEKVALLAAAKFMAVTDAGAIVTPEQYGKSTVAGVDGDVALEYKAAPKWIVRLGGTLTYVGYTFQQGAGELSSNRDGDIDTLDVGGAADRYIGGYLTAGYLY